MIHLKVWKIKCCVVLVDDAQPGIEQSLPRSLEDHILWQSRQSVFRKTAATHHHSATRCCCTRNRFTQNQPLTGGLFVCDLWPPEFNRQHTATHPPTVFNRRLCTVHSGIGLLESRVCPTACLVGNAAAADGADGNVAAM